MATPCHEHYEVRSIDSYPDGPNSMRVLRLEKALPLLLKVTGKYIAREEVCQGHTRNCR